MDVQVGQLNAKISTLVSKWTVKYAVFKFIIILRKKKKSMH